MLDLEQTLKGDPRIAMRMAEIMKSKTAKQLRDKRNDPPNIAKRQARLAQEHVGVDLENTEEGDLNSHRVHRDQDDEGHRNEDACILYADHGSMEDDWNSHVVSQTSEEDNCILHPDLQYLGDCNPSTVYRKDDACVPTVEGDCISYEIREVNEVNDQETHEVHQDQEDGSALPTDYDAEALWREELVSSLNALKGFEKQKDVADVMNAIKEAAKRPCSLHILDDLYAAILKILTKVASPIAPINYSKKKRAEGKNRKRSTKRHRYARTQTLFKKSPGLLARHIRMGTDFAAQNTEELDRQEIKLLYDSLWGTKPHLRQPAPIATSETIPPRSFLKAITQDEVCMRMKRMKKATAPGPDGIKLETLSKESIKTLLCALYNLILISGNLPSDWSQNRTTLILSRLFWGIIDQRLRMVVKQNPRQKGFVAETGCFANVQILLEIVKRMKNENGGIGIQLDIAKAFDTVPHEAIGPALARKGIPKCFLDLVAGSYKGVQTSISHPKGDISISLKRGVKQ